MNWRMQHQRCRLQGERLIAYFGGEQIGETLSIHVGKAPDAIWVAEMWGVIEEIKRVTAAALVCQFCLLVERVSMDGEALETISYEPAA